MHKARILLLFGLWVAVLPYLGFPYSMKNILFTLTGLLLILFGYVFYKNNKSEEKPYDNFSENNNFTQKKVI